MTSFRTADAYLGGTILLQWVGKYDGALMTAR
jgi:hypothetical protein